MYYISLSTIPSRMSNLPYLIESLQQQIIKPTKIFVNIPNVYRRFPFAEVILPDLSQYPNVVINRCVHDYGAATKFLPLLLLPEIKPDDRIIIVDDDHTYDPTLCVKLLELSDKYPDAVTCMFGVTNALYFKNRSWNTEMNTQEKEPVGFRGYKEGYIDVFEGFAGVCLQKRFFTPDVFFFPIPDIYAHDDIWLSANVLRNGFHIIVSDKTVSNKAFQDKVDALCLDDETFQKSINLITFIQKNYNLYI